MPTEAFASRRKLGERLCQWHSGQGDPIYAVGSFYLDNQEYPDIEVVRRAIWNLNRCKREGTPSAEDKTELDDLIAALKAIVVAAETPASTYLDGYLRCALWTGIDEQGEPMDDTFGPEAFSAADRALAEDHISRFLALAGEADVLEAEAANVDIGHDLWLTSQGHGTGFWDRGLGEVGDRLTKAAKLSGQTDVYEGDDNKPHLT